MPLLLLLFLLLITLHDSWWNPLGLEPAESCFFTLCGSAGLILAAEFINLATCRALRRAPGDRTAIMRRHARFKRWHVIGLVAFFLVALYFLGWGNAIHSLEPEFIVPGFKVAMLAPLLAGLIWGWVRNYQVDRLNADILHYPQLATFLSRWAYFGLQARHSLLFVLPPMTLLVAHETLLLLVPDDTKHSLLMAAAGAALLATALVIMPVFLRIFLGLTPLPDGQLRRRLFDKAGMLRFRFANVLVWNTRRGVANAMVTGVLPWLRYVIVTDRLLEDLTEDEIEAVFGHEVGHMKHHHMFFYMLFIVGSLFLLGGLWKAGTAWLKTIAMPGWLSALAGDAAWETIGVWFILVIVAAYVLVVFGWLSRRCERQADIYGCKTATSAAFISALEKVADVNGISRERPGFFSWWQHSTIADRIGFIRRMESDPALEPAFQRRLGWTKWSVALGLIALVALFVNELGVGFVIAVMK
jgi:STE24 endopeptidase